MIARASAYHLVLRAGHRHAVHRPRVHGAGGPPGKDWSSCPGNGPCTDKASRNYGASVGCFSFTNDSSLLLPSTALTGNARVIAYPGESATLGAVLTPIMASTLSITAVTGATHVKVLVARGRRRAAGPLGREDRGRR